MFKMFLYILMLLVQQPSSIQPESVTSFHHCSVVGGSWNYPHLFDVSKIYKCDEGIIEVAGQSTAAIEKGWVYEQEMGEPVGEPHLATRDDFENRKWCPHPTPGDPNRKIRCGDKPGKCWDGKLGTWDPDWQGYSCVTPDNK